jgi:hypothetical protein
MPPVPVLGEVDSPSVLTQATPLTIARVLTRAFRPRADKKWDIAELLRPYSF